MTAEFKTSKVKVEMDYDEWVLIREKLEELYHRLNAANQVNDMARIHVIRTLLTENENTEIELLPQPVV